MANVSGVQKWQLDFVQDIQKSVNGVLSSSNSAKDTSLKEDVVEMVKDPYYLIRDLFIYVPAKASQKIGFNYNPSDTCPKSIGFIAMFGGCPKR